MASLKASIPLYRIEYAPYIALWNTLFFGIHQPLFYLYWSTKTGHISYRQISAVSIAKLTLELDDRLLLDIRTNFMSSVTKLGKLDDQLGEIRASIVMKPAVPGGTQHREATKFEKPVEKETLARHALSSI